MLASYTLVLPSFSNSAFFASNCLKLSSRYLRNINKFVHTALLKNLLAKVLLIVAIDVIRNPMDGFLQGIAGSFGDGCRKLLFLLTSRGILLSKHFNVFEVLLGSSGLTKKR